MYIFIVSSNLNEGGEGGLAVLTILFMMSLPMSLTATIFQPVLAGYFNDRSIIVYLFVTGYLQWFVIIPYFIDKFRKKNQKQI
jgi:hypothetical protein